MAPPPGTTNRAQLPSHCFAQPLLQGLPTSSVTDSALRWPRLRTVQLLQRLLLWCPSADDLCRWLLRFDNAVRLSPAACPTVSFQSLYHLPNLRQQFVLPSCPGTPALVRWLHLLPVTLGNTH